MTKRRVNAFNSIKFDGEVAENHLFFTGVNPRAVGSHANLNAVGGGLGAPPPKN